MTKKYITEEHKAELEKELIKLRGELQGKIADRLAESTSKNQAEDSEYAQAVQDRDMLQERIEDLESLIEESGVIEKETCNTEYVTLGAWITMEMNGNGEKELRLVGASEANPAKGSVSYESPLGEALLGAKVSETVYVLSPTGEEQEIKVLSIRLSLIHI